MNWLYLVIAILSEVLATTFLKLSDGFTNFLPSLVVLFGYGAAFYFLSLTLRTIPIGIAYAIWSGAGIVLISILGWLVYEQKLDFSTILGISLIVLGVVIVNFSSQVTANH